MVSQSESYRLSEEQKKFWLANGFLKIPKCFSKETAADFTSTIWTRLGGSAEDKSTWPVNRLNMPGHVTIPARDFAPRAWDVVCELLGGEDRIADWCKNWTDKFIVNLGSPENDDKPAPAADSRQDYRSLDFWHADGDWFFHFLDSPEQALLIIPLFTDIQPNGGGTIICTDGIPLVAKTLHKHPEGMTPFFGPRNGQDAMDPRKRVFWNDYIKNPEICREESFHEVTGEIGDVFVLHPHMLHTASNNLLRQPRIITNPPVMLKEPFKFNRSNPSGYSLVEQKTLRELGHPDGLPEWKATGTRERVVSSRVPRQQAIKVEEIRRLEEAGVAPNKIATTPLVDEDYPS